MLKVKGCASVPLSAAAAPDFTPPAEITFHEKIGAHDVSVIHVLSGLDFVGWVNNFLTRASVTDPTIPPALRQVVQEYLDDGLRWFAFDVSRGQRPCRKVSNRANQRPRDDNF